MRKMMLAALCMTTLLGACAASPGSIQPVSMGNAYAGLDCQTAANMLAQARASEASLTQSQNNAVAGDAIGVFMLGIPLGSLAGAEVEGELAAVKGQVLALEARLATCGVRTM